MRMPIAWIVVALVACGKNNEPPPPSSGAPPSTPTESGPSKPAPAPSGNPGLEQAKKMYSTVCVMCHGPSGAGDGQAAQALDPKPRNYTDAAWQASVTDDDIKKIILQGGAGVGKSASMPANPQLKEHPEVVDGLVTLIRGFGKK